MAVTVGKVGGGCEDEADGVGAHAATAIIKPITLSAPVI
jgi:hypothetical protein